MRAPAPVSPRGISRTPRASPTPSFAPPLADHRLRRARLRHQRHYLLRKALHLLELRAALQQQQVHTHRLEVAHAFRHLLRRAHEPRAEPAIRDRVVLETDLLLELRIRDPVTVVALSLIHISEPTRRTPISYAVFCLKKK